MRRAEESMSSHCSNKALQDILLVLCHSRVSLQGQQRPDKYRMTPWARLASSVMQMLERGCTWHTYASGLVQAHNISAKVLSFRIRTPKAPSQSARVLLFAVLRDPGSCKLMKYLCKWVGTRTRQKVPECYYLQYVVARLWHGFLYKNPTSTRYKSQSAIIYNTLAPGFL